MERRRWFVTTVNQEEEEQVGVLPHFFQVRRGPLSIRFEVRRRHFHKGSS